MKTKQKLFSQTEIQILIQSDRFSVSMLHKFLEENGVGTVIHYPIAPHKQECYANEAWNTPQLSLPITELIADCELSLPISPTMTIKEAAEVVRLVNAFKE